MLSSKSDYPQLLKVHSKESPSKNLEIKLNSLEIQTKKEKENKDSKTKILQTHQVLTISVSI